MHYTIEKEASVTASHHQRIKGNRVKWYVVNFYTVFGIKIHANDNEGIQSNEYK